MTELQQTAAELTGAGRGILAADESIATMSKRLAAAGVTASAETRRDYRELLLTTPQLSEWVAGIILSDETIGQTLGDGTPFPRACAAAGIQPGIKVDTGTVPLPFSTGGFVTEGLDGLRGRLESYGERGATFAKWRAVLAPAGLGRRTIRANAHALARYAALCQEARLVPIVEPEVLLEGKHPIAMCEAATANSLAAVFDELELMGVDPSGIVLKPNMVLPGASSGAHVTPEEVARRTLHVLTANVPAGVPGIAFLSGGQSNERACANLAAITELAADDPRAGWQLTFSFGRALVDDALRTWAGQPANLTAAQQVLAQNCRRASEATTVELDPAAAARRQPVAV
jgi:fructose-bisphosphate aldolase, class I